MYSKTADSRPPIWVIGDCILDANKFVTFSRPSPECASCPVGVGERREVLLGGAGNVAAWLATADVSHHVNLYGHWGRHDQNMRLLANAAHEANVHLGAGLERRDGIITTKERIYLKQDEEWRQIIRIDRDTDMRLMEQEADYFLGSLEKTLGYLEAPPVIVIADYDKGVFTGDAGALLIKNLSVFVEEHKLLAVVNSKVPARWSAFPADVLVCNDAEFRRVWNPDDPFRVAADHLIVTRGAQGVMLWVAAGTGCGGMRVMIRHLDRPSRATEVRDVSGAGDAFLAGLTAELMWHGFNHGDRASGDLLISALDAGQARAAECCAQYGVGKPGGVLCEAT